jgi:hypothetical protein
VPVLSGQFFGQLGASASACGSWAREKPFAILPIYNYIKHALLEVKNSERYSVSGIMESLGVVDKNLLFNCLCTCHR